MTQPNEQLIETIQRALDRWDSACEKGEAVSAGQFIEENCEEWLRALLEEVSHWKDEALLQARLYTEKNAKLQQTREELNKSQSQIRRYAEVGANKIEEVESIQTELEQVKAELSDFKFTDKKAAEELNRLYTELAAKDEVLKAISVSVVHGESWYRYQARDVLKHYPPREKGADNENRIRT